MEHFSGGRQVDSDHENAYHVNCSTKDCLNVGLDGGSWEMIGPIERPPTLTTTVAESIRNSIFKGDLPPSDPLREMELSEALGVSRSTVREALRLLHEEKLVEIIPHRGAFVIKLSKPTARELYTLRAILEPYALRLAMADQSFEAADLARLDQLAQQLNELEQAPDTTFETVRTDLELHELIVRRSRHELLISMYKSLRSLTGLYVSHFKLFETDAYAAAPSHTAISRSIREGDAEKASRILEEHISRSGAALLDRMEDV
jgi:DNA-binding GntR family transcriptional regulator